MPEQGLSCISHNEILTYEEIERLCRIFVKLGVHKFKITGGEPLVRKNCEVLVDKLHRLEGVDSITMTTNGVLLPKQIDALMKAGLTAVNISIDAMSSNSYEKITRSNQWEATKAGMEAALNYPTLRIKINCVPVVGMNEEELSKIAELARNQELHVRFIEMMPIGLGRDFHFMSEDEVKELLETRLGSFTPCFDSLGNGPAHYYTVPGFKGKIGFISARTHKFCESCNRIRLTSDGFLKTCLQYNTGCDLKQLLRSNASDDEIESAIKETLMEKPDCHHFEAENQEADEDQRKMSGIGG
jgi:cyclic pyranopterin phosphate synthase